MTFETDMLALVPQLRGYARRMVVTGEGDDLVQDVLTRALAAKDRFQDGTNLRAWLFTILRNRFYNFYANREKRTLPLDDATAETLRIEPVQEWSLRNADLKRALAQLPPTLREALLLSAGAEMSYAEIGEVIGCPSGTVKSRVFRARQELARLLDGGLARKKAS
ncbi:sigma-70 family RNA polymerase sigma factor [Rhodovarius crocodyli]|uniref:Sigma-70 family RNA polymerase sigma factor n=1 Tax=Rhodovarius crocodyli TaxID=1979269 RepID=A0A437MDX1_9PROT|nr:sigma-70 family RNA polymerase sigma factor [Rhodovarius crocodyli]RVT95796.1 sigma-70 family RNA polymerase sigma factor [Rhodovarius crocodyli]